MLGIPTERRQKIFALALPIMLGMVSQAILNVVDTLMVSTLGTAAISAVGFGGYAYFLSTSFITGMSAGVQAIASRRKGEGRAHETAVSLNGGLLAAVCISIPLSITLIAATPFLFPFLSTDSQVVEIGVPYLQLRLVAMIAIGANFAFRGYWNGIDKSQLYLRSLLLMHLSNVAISYVLIFGKFGAPPLGANGAAIGTSASAFIGAFYYFYQGIAREKSAGFLRGVPSRATMLSMLKLSVPSGLQSLFFAAGLTAMLAIVDRIGTNEAAAVNVLVNVTMLAFLPGLGLGLASATLVGQALGRSDVDDAERWAWDVVKIGIFLMLLLSLPMAIAPQRVLSAFFENEPIALRIATLPLRLAGLTIWTEAILMVLLNSMMGAGATRLCLVVNIGMQWGLFLPAAYLAGPVLGWGLVGVWGIRIAYRATQSAIFVVLWRKRYWANIQV